MPTRCGHAQRRRGHPVDAARPAVGKKGSGFVRGREERVEVPHRHAVPREQQTAAGQQVRQLGKDRALEQVFKPVELFPDSRSGHCGGFLPGLYPRVGRPVGSDLRDEAFAEPGRVRAPHLSRQVARVAPARPAVDVDMPRPPAALQEPDERLGDGHRPEPQHALWFQCCRCVPDERVVAVNDKALVVGTAAHPGEAVRQHRIAELLRQCRRRLRGRPAGTRSADDEPFFNAFQFRRQPPQLALRRQCFAFQYLDRWDVFRQVWLVDRHVLRHDTRFERFPEGEIQVHRSGRRRRCRREGPGRRRPGMVYQVRRGLRRGHGNVPLGVAAVEPCLVYRLQRSPVYQLRRPVRREDEQRHRAVACLDDRRQEVGRRRSGAAHERHRLAEVLRHAEGEKARRALVEVHPLFDARRPVEGYRQRRGAGAGADADVPQSGPGKRFHEGPGDDVVAVLPGHDYRSGASAASRG